VFVLLLYLLHGACAGGRLLYLSAILLRRGFLLSLFSGADLCLYSACAFKRRDRTAFHAGKGGGAFKQQTPRRPAFGTLVSDWACGNMTLEPVDALQRFRGRVERTGFGFCWTLRIWSDRSTGMVQRAFTAPDRCQTPQHTHGVSPGTCGALIILPLLQPTFRAARRHSVGGRMIVCHLFVC